MEYGPALENSDAAQQWLNSHSRQFQLYIDGQWVQPNKEDYFPSVNPATEEVLAHIASADTHDVDKAVKAAQKALPKWQKIGAHHRARYLYAIARQIQKHARILAVLETLDNGKPIRESRDIDIPLVARHFYHHAGWAQLKEDQLHNFTPVGVVGQIIPWNFPLLMLAWKIAPALAAGNTVILKPAEYTSLTALYFAEICQQIGLPNGVVNIVTGAGDTGEHIVNHEGIQKIAFTGSTEVGKIIRRATAGTDKKLSLELGGKSPFIVFESADIDSAIEGVVDAIWFNQGQVCCAGSRLLIQEGIQATFVEKLKARMQQLRVGNPLDKTVDIGAIVDNRQLSTIDSLVKKGIEEGGSIWQNTTDIPKKGCFYPPTLFTEVSPASTIVQEEIFGPVLSIMSFRTPAEAITLANNTKYGLAASIWTEDINLALDMAPQIKAGVIWINSTNLFDAASGFGGYKESGFGREGGLEGMHEYMYSPLPTTTTKRKTVKQKNNKSPLPLLDRTPKMYIGGKQSRPDNGQSINSYYADGSIAGQFGSGSRKDIRNAVEAAHKASAWTQKTGHQRAQVLYFIGENLSARQQEFAQDISQLTGVSNTDANAEVDAAISCIFTYAAWADKYDGNVHHTAKKHITLAMPEALGVMGIVCPEEQPLLSLIATVIPAIAMGNRTIVIPHLQNALIATNFYQILDTSDVPAGVINIVTGDSNTLAKVIAEHYDVDAIWYFGDQDGKQQIERAAADNMKRTWAHYATIDWGKLTAINHQHFLRQATQIKNIWVPYGV